MEPAGLVSEFTMFLCMELSWCTDRSDNFATEYPELEGFLLQYLVGFCPTCVSLGPSGTFFARTTSRVFHNLPKTTKSHIGNMSNVQGVWLGIAETYIALRTDGSLRWNIGGHYENLAEKLQEKSSTSVIKVGSIYLESETKLIVVLGDRNECRGWKVVDTRLEQRSSA